MTAKSRKQQIEEMLTEDPNDTFLRYGLAMEYVSAKDDEAAVRAFHDLLAIDPAHVAGYMQAGQALVRLGRDAEARDILMKGSQAALQQGNQHAYEEMQGFLANIE
jgi:predicted Zn-dependent protease